MRYVVKCGDLYADGAGDWVAQQKGAFVFDADGIEIFGSARNWAQEHANFLGLGRVVKLVKKRKKEGSK